MKRQKRSERGERLKREKLVYIDYREGEKQKGVELN